MAQQQIVEEIRRTQQDRISQAKEIKELFNKYQKWLKTQYNTTPFKEPVLMLIRRSGDVEFYEGATAGLFNFKHSDDTDRFIIMTPNKQLKFGFADRRFRGYVCHEDFPLPLPQDPFLTSEQVNIIIEKSLNDIKKWKAQEIAARGKMFWSILLGVVLIILAVGIVLMVLPDKAGETVIVAKDTAITVAQNLSNSPTILG